MSDAGSISSELVMCGGCVRSILLLPLVASCLETIDVCMWRMFVFMYVVVTVWECWSGMQEKTIWKRHTPEPLS